MHNPYQPPGAPPPGWGPPPPPNPYGYPPFGAPPPGQVPFGAASPHGPTYDQKQWQETLQDREIADYANGALISSIAGFLCGLSIIGGPIGILRANKALTMIEQHNKGHEHATKAKIARAIAVLSMVVQTAAVAYLLFFS